MLDSTMQLIALEKVFEEMSRAEEYVGVWKASWYEQYLDVYSDDLYGMRDADLLDFQESYHNHYLLEGVRPLEQRNGETLRKVTLIGDYGEEYNCEFAKVVWEGMCSKKAIRSFSFANDGEISFTKTDKIKSDKRRKNTGKDHIYTSYEATYNVLADDFRLDVTVDRVTGEKYSRRYRDYISFSRLGDVVVKRFNDIYIYHDLNTNRKMIRIEKKYNKKNKSYNSAVTFEAVLDTFDTFQRGAVDIKTYKGNGKVNGTYRFDVSREKGARAKFYSRKGVKIDLIRHPEILAKANLLLSTNSSSTSDMVISNFADSTQQAVADSLNNRVISFDATDFNMKAVHDAERKVVDTVKRIKGELPLFGLTERINYSFLLMNPVGHLPKNDFGKVLEKK